MTHCPSGWLRPAKNLLATIACVAMLGASSSSAFAQAGNRVRAEYPELADLLNAFDVTQAQAFDDIARINAEPQYKAARVALGEHMAKMKKMTMSEMIAYGSMMHAENIPYAEQELAARINLLTLMRAKHDDEEVANVYARSGVISRHAAEILRRGRNFENNLFEIYLDDGIKDKLAAIDEAIKEYLSDEKHSVATLPKESRYLIYHEQADGFKTAFPRLSALMWTQQWLQLASLEAIILGQMDTQFADSMDVAMERFWNKVGTDGGMSMFPPPSELPMAPAIAPDLYTQSPDAAIILDNLNILETVLADILAYPEVMGREEKMDAAVALFTNKDVERNVRPLDYLLFALRGGIYDQGGPVLGDLARSERNRSRDAMNLVHGVTLKAGE